MIFKESVNNLVRHSESPRANVNFGVDQRSLVLEIEDEGHGFDVHAESGGHGLFSMRQRARNIDGELTITSESGRGTRVVLQVPLAPHRRWSFKKYPPE